MPPAAEIEESAVLAGDCEEESEAGRTSRGREGEREGGRLAGDGGEERREWTVARGCVSLLVIIDVRWPSMTFHERTRDGGNRSAGPTVPLIRLVFH